MSPYDKLDKVLEIIVVNEATSFNQYSINKLLQEENIQIGDKELTEILIKLAEDGNVTKLKPSPNEPSYYFSAFNGRMFYLEGGYKTKLNRNRRERIQKRARMVLDVVNIFAIIILTILILLTDMGYLHATVTTSAKFH